MQLYAKNLDERSPNFEIITTGEYQTVNAGEQELPTEISTIFVHK